MTCEEKIKLPSFLNLFASLGTNLLLGPVKEAAQAHFRHQALHPSPRLHSDFLLYPCPATHSLPSLPSFRKASSLSG